MIKLLLNCEENVVLHALDSRGKRAIDLCPYSSPIFKVIRNQLQRRTKVKVHQPLAEEYENAEAEGLHGRVQEPS